MLLTLGTIAITSGTLYGGAKAYTERKKKKERPWAYALEKFNKRNKKAKLIRMKQPVVNEASVSSYHKLSAKLFRKEDEPSLFDKLFAPLLGQQRQQLEEITGQKYEMSAEEKHSWSPGQEGLSHRARAFAKFAEACLG